MYNNKVIGKICFFLSCCHFLIYLPDNQRFESDSNDHGMTATAVTPLASRLLDGVYLC